MSYWGIRSPDGEIVFRSTQSLMEHGDFSVQQELAWKGFGVAPGKNGKNYSIFGPGQTVASAGFYQVGAALGHVHFYRKHPRLVGVSHYFDGGVANYVTGEGVSNLTQHGIRSFMGWFNIMVGAFSVVTFYILLRRLRVSSGASILTTLLFGFGTLFFPYTGTFFSEPLATEFSMISLLFLIAPASGPHWRKLLFLFFGGFMLGLATSVHITAILFMPFFLLYGLWGRASNRSGCWRQSVQLGGCFLLGIGLCLIWLGYYNHLRFGDWLETGRSVEGAFQYGTWTWPRRGLEGLLFSAGKGFIFYCPAVVLGLCFWRRFYVRDRLLALILLSAALFRLGFIASRSDWSGGLCLGPRYLVMIIPFLLLPVGVLLDELLAEKRWKRVALLGMISFLCIAQQVYFSLGEVFSYWRCNGILNGVNLFNHGAIYETWEVSPLLYLMDGQRGPLLLRFSNLNNRALLLCLVVLSGLLVLWCYLSVVRGCALAARGHEPIGAAQRVPD